MECSFSRVKRVEDRRHDNRRDDRQQYAKQSDLLACFINGAFEEKPLLVGPAIDGHVRPTGHGGRHGRRVGAGRNPQITALICGNDVSGIPTGERW